MVNKTFALKERGCVALPLALGAGEKRLLQQKFSPVREVALVLVG